MPVVTVDAVEGIAVDSDDCFNEIRTIQTLSVGLRKLADSIKQREMKWEQLCAKYVVHTYGRDVDGTRDGLDMIACFCHWFGVSVCNVARLAGFIRGLSRGDFTRSDLGDRSKFKAIAESVKAYVSGVPELSSVLVWRNKVGAHFAITEPWKDDNAATLDASVVFPVTFTDGRYRVAEMTLTKGNVTASHTSAIPSWSVTEVFESLIPRYWPGITIGSVQPAAGGDHQAGEGR